MSRIVQEKFQVDYPPAKDNGYTEWASDSSARRTRSAGNRLNQLPPGMDIGDQKNSMQPDQPFVTSGESDVSKDMNAEAARQGFTRRTMRPTDDMYTREHNDAFYDEVKVDGVTGFLERNNMLDRM